jgi:hypothetical protein
MSAQYDSPSPTTATSWLSSPISRSTPATGPPALAGRQGHNPRLIRHARHGLPLGRDDDGMRIMRLDDGDSEPLECAARRFRDGPTAGPDGFLRDGRAACFAALDGPEVAGWA